MSITQGLGEGVTNCKSSLFCHASVTEQEGGGSTLLSCSQTQRQLKGSPWKSSLPSTGAGRGRQGLCCCCQEQEDLEQRADPQRSEKLRIRQERQLLEGWVD